MNNSLWVGLGAITVAAMIALIGAVLGWGTELGAGYLVVFITLVVLIVLIARKGYGA